MSRERSAGNSTVSGPVTDAQLAGRLRLVGGRLARRLRRSQDDGLTPSQLSALSTIERHGPIRLGDLAARERVSPPALTPVVASLGRLQLVQRHPDPDDGRSALMSITAPGRQLLGHARDGYTASLTRSIGSLSRVDRDRLAAALPVLEQLTESSTSDDP